MNGSTTGIVPTLPLNGGNSGFFGGEGIWAVIILALLFGSNSWGGFGNGWGGNNVATTDFVSSEFTQRDVTNGTQSILTSLSSGFSDAATNLCNVRSDILTTALQAQAKMDECCCTLRAQGIENTQKILDAMNQNTIDDLRSQVNDLKNTITANGIGTSIVNQVRPYPIPAYAVSSPYVGLYNGFYGNGFYGNTIV